MVSRAGNALASRTIPRLGSVSRESLGRRDAGRSCTNTLIPRAVPRLGAITREATRRRDMGGSCTDALILRTVPWLSAVAGAVSRWANSVSRQVVRLGSVFGSNSVYLWLESLFDQHDVL